MAKQLRRNMCSLGCACDRGDWICGAGEAEMRLKRNINGKKVSNIFTNVRLFSRSRPHPTSECYFPTLICQHYAVREPYDHSRISKL